MRSGMVGFLGAQPAATGDPYWANVASLLNFDGADGSTEITDETGRIWTPYGNAQLDTSYSKWGVSSLLLGGAGDFLSTPDSADLRFTESTVGAVEGFIRPTSTTGIRALYGKRNSTGTARGYIFFIDGGVLRLVAWGAGGAVAFNLTGTTVIPAGGEAFVQWLMDGEEWGIAVDGVVEASSSAAVAVVNGADLGLLGRDGTSAARDYVGNMDGWRLTNGAGRPIVVPTGPFPNA